jgi:PAS domain S-box-containing protein
MKPDPAHSPRSAIRWWLPLLILGMGLLVNVRGWERARQSHQRQVSDYFNFRSRDALHQLERRLHYYEQALLATRGLFNASQAVSRKEFATFVASIELAESLPGLQGIGFGQQVPAAERARHLANVRRQGLPGYQIHPNGNRDTFRPILFLEPSQGDNLQAFGFDLGVDAVRREALDRARDTGRISLSGMVRMGAETEADPQAGFLVCVPVYENGQPPATLEERRRKLVGWVFAPFRMDDFLQGVLGEGERDLDFHVFDGPEAKPEALMFDQDSGAAWRAISALQARQVLVFGGHSWTLETYATPGLVARQGGEPSKTGLILGGLSTLLLSLLIYFLVLTWERTSARAKAGEDRYRTLMAQAQDAILVLDETGHILELNRQALESFGYPLEALLGRSMGVLCDPTPEDGDDPCLEELRRLGSVHPPHLFRRRDGSHFIGESTISPVSFESNLFHLVVVRDVTEQQQLAEALKASRTLLGAIINGTTDAIYVKDPQGRYLLINAAGERYVGKSTGEILGRDDTSLFAAEEAAIVMAADRSVMESGGIRTYEESVTVATGGVVVFLSTKGPLYHPDGTLLGLFGIARDITDRRRAEAAQVESDTRLRAILDTALDAVIGIDSLGTITEWNARAETVFGWTKAEAVGQDLARLIIPAEHQEAHRQGLERFLATGETRILNRRIEITALRRDGREFPVELAITLLITAGTRHFTAFLSDISERKEAEAERRLLQAQLQHSQKMESLGQLAGGVAHEMNNVLAAILGMASAHLELQSPEGPAHRAFDTIVKASTRGRKVVRELLSLSRKGLEEESEIDLNFLVREEVQLLERTTLARVRLEMDLAPDLPMIRGDAHALSHVLMNLCLNAVDALPDQGLLSLRTRRRSGQAEIEVQDTGCGMAQEVLERAMEPFFTTKPQGKGTGLGLSIAYGTVKAHRGVMELHSAPGQGTRILLRFPAAQESPTSSNRPPGPGDLGDPAGPSAGLGLAPPGME